MNSPNGLYYQPSVLPSEAGCVIQYVADNGDHNVAIANSLITFNSMAVIKIDAPHHRVDDSTQALCRLKVTSSVSELTKNTHISIKRYENQGV